MWCGDLTLEFDTPEARDTMLDGLRFLRCQQSSAFEQSLEGMRQDGMR